MNQWGFFFDQKRCLGCKACMLACKNWNDERRGDAGINAMPTPGSLLERTPEGTMEKSAHYLDPETGDTNNAETRRFYMKENWRRMTVHENGSTVIAPDLTFDVTTTTSRISVACNHCTAPACVSACPVGCIYKEDTIGAVIVNNAACISCGKCRSACPWDAPQYYRDDFAKFALSDPKRPKMTKCTFCLDRINEGLKPMCVAACWNRALDSGPIGELESKYKAKGYELSKTMPVQFEDLSTGPNIIFRLQK